MKYKAPKSPFAKIVAAAKYDFMLAVFVVDAAAKFADKVIAEEAAVIESMKNSLVSGEAWVEAAKNVKAAIK
jgi:hypothetical protein